MKATLPLFAFLFVTVITFAQGNNGLVAHWNFNGNANDISGHNLNGVVSGATLTSGFNGISNTAYYFNGTSDHIDVANNSLLNLDSFSICTLVRPTGFYSGNCQANFILSRGAQGSNPSDLFYLSYDDNSYDNDCATATLSHEIFHADCHASSTPAVTTWYSNTDTVRLNTWVCITATYTHDSIRMYIDGTLRKTLYLPDSYIGGTDSLGIGYNAAGLFSGFPYWFNGTIDDIRLYNRALSATEAVEYCDTAKMLPTSVPVVSNYTPGITIAPNPAHNYISIYLPDNAGTSNVQFINTLGQVIADMKPNSRSVNLDISILPAGLYIIRAECNGQTIFRKVLKN